MGYRRSQTWDTVAAYVIIYHWHMIYARHWPPACLRSWAEFNFAGKPAIVGDENILCEHQMLKTVLEYTFKHLEVRQKYHATRRIFNSLFGVWKCGPTLSFVFDILHHTLHCWALVINCIVSYNWYLHYFADGFIFIIKICTAKKPS